MARLAVPPPSGATRLDAEYVVQLPGARQLVLPLILRLFQHVAAVRQRLVKEFTRLVRMVEYVLGWHAEHLDNLVHLINLVGAAEQRFARVHLDEDAAQRPHVDGQVVGDAQQHLG